MQQAHEWKEVAYMQRRSRWVNAGIHHLRRRVESIIEFLFSTNDGMLSCYGRAEDYEAYRVTCWMKPRCSRVLSRPDVYDLRWVSPTANRKVQGAT